MSMTASYTRVPTGEIYISSINRASLGTRPSGERESGSYSGTRQRNRIQFGPS